MEDETLRSNVDQNVDDVDATHVELDQNIIEANQAQSHVSTLMQKISTVRRVKNAFLAAQSTSRSLSFEERKTKKLFAVLEAAVSADMWCSVYASPIPEVRMTAKLEPFSILEPGAAPS